MDVTHSVEALLRRCPDLAHDDGLKRMASGGLSLKDGLEVLVRVASLPAYTLALATCFRGSLLRLASALVEAHIKKSAQAPASDTAALSVALISFLELAPHINKVVLRFFSVFPAPHSYTLVADPSFSDYEAHADLAFAALRAMQLEPALRAKWTLLTPAGLLQHQNSDVRWAGVHMIALDMDLSDHSKEQLMNQHLTLKQLVGAWDRWQARLDSLALEHSAAWLYEPHTCGHCSIASADGTATTSATAAAGLSVPLSPDGVKQPKKKKRKQQAGAAAQEVEAAASLATGAIVLPPASGYVEVCGIELPCSDDAETRDATSAASTSGRPWSPSGATTFSDDPLAHLRPQPPPFATVPSASRNLEACAMALCAGRPLLLEGPPGSGKTRLIDQLASVTGNSGGMVRIHLDDQMDAKSLLGAYVCTAVPGEFAWQPGPLTQAVVEGRWVVIEDANMAPPDVLAALVPLLENRTLALPSRGEVLEAAPGFQLLATVTSAPGSAGDGVSGSGGGGAYGSSQMVKELLGSLWAYVRLESPDEDEQIQMLAKAHPQLLPLLPTAISQLSLLQQAAGHAHTPVSGQAAWWHAQAARALAAAGVRSGSLALQLSRHFSVRDLFKWCDRMQSLHGSLVCSRALQQLSSQVPHVDLPSVELEIRVAAFTESADLFAALVSKAESRTRLLRALAALWGLPEERYVEQYETLGKPSLEVGAEHEVVIGRVVLPRAPADHLGAPAASASSTFASTGHAMRMMERTAAALARSEPVLLVGETGTGKTTLLSRAAALTRSRLVAFNMSQQTDSSDLLGGFKPVDVRDALLPMLAPFLSLIRQTYTKGNNEDFLSRCTKLAERRKWSQLLQAFKTGLSKVDASQTTSPDSADAAVAEPQILPAAVTPASPVPSAPVAVEKTPGKAAAKGKGSRKSSAAAAAVAAAAVVAEVEMMDAVAAAAAEADEQQPNKRRKVQLTEPLRHEWRQFASDLAAAERSAAASRGGFAFAFVEGKLVQALRHGWWLLLDEINLAPSEVLERIAGILEGGGTGSVTLVERGDTMQVPRHPNFRLVAAMNPATDAGKRELPAALRNRFTELWVPEPNGREDLRALVHSYLAGVGGPMPPIDTVVDFYLAAKVEAESVLSDGAGQRPCYNLRTLCRALDYARTSAPTYSLQRALYDGFAMGFLTLLDPASAPRMEALMLKHLLPGAKSVKALLSRAPATPAGAGPDTITPTHVLFEHFWLEAGPLPRPAGGRDVDSSGRQFVATPSVHQHLVNLARAVLIRKHPVLLQGPTSSGKTSLVGYLAAQTGHKLIRINNHEHTDLQEYLGSYVPDENGRLVFREGALVTAVRQGHWVVLDELNLAPTEVLEALNRLLDDNRELFVPELQEVVKPHPHFLLFATQNPPGLYAGRKALSRAFRSRFLELHVEDLPDTELAEILEKRCSIAPSYASKLVSVMRELQRRRQASNAFAGRHGYITPRDLFRWAERGAVGYTELAEHGSMILGERLRSAEERGVVVEVLQRVMKAQIDMEEIYLREGDAPLRRLTAALQLQQQQQQLQQLPADGTSAVQHSENASAIEAAMRGVVWTRSMRRLYTLLDRCLQHQEPVLLVGETGTGKTTVCQLLALMRSQRLHMLNCNQHTEASDFLGGFRPARSRVAAVAAMRAAAAAAAASPLMTDVPDKLPGLDLATEGDAEMSPAELVALMSALERASTSAVGLAEVRLAKFEGQLLEGEDGAGERVEELRAQLAELKKDVAAASSSAASARAPFQWADGPLVTAMRNGDMILVDEINLAEDAVLERLNSVLEPGRTLTLAERGGEGAEVVTAAPGFLLVATMNPGGDFGKKELSPALTNRFTVVWVPALEDDAELLAILQARLEGESARITIAPLLLSFWRFFLDHACSSARASLSVRDLLSWVHFINAVAPAIGDLPAYAHGAHLTLLDGIGLTAGVSPSAALALRARCHAHLLSQLPEACGARLHAQLAAGSLTTAVPELVRLGLLASQAPAGRWGLPPFYVPLAIDGQSAADGSGFELSAPTTARNAFRILRALQVPKAVLLEGSPGVGKTTLIAALAKKIGQHLVRINLSEATDMMDLLGADLPAEGGAPGQFAWCDGPLLGALRAGHWVLLDELNLASQAVLEGLNALLDHRAEVFVPELGTSFKCHPGFRLFGAQNPLQEGGGRKGLPRSFLNRFTRVHVELLTREDMLLIAGALHPSIPAALLEKMVLLLGRLEARASAGGGGGGFAQQGGPWEFNLRDLLRWCSLAEGAAATEAGEAAAAAVAAMDVDGDSTPDLSAVTAAVPSDQAVEAAVLHYSRMLFELRLRTPLDRDVFAQLLARAWGSAKLLQCSLDDVSAAGGEGSGDVAGGSDPAGAACWGRSPSVVLSTEVALIGRARLMRATAPMPAMQASLGASQKVSPQLQLLPWQLPLLESAASAVSRGWMVLLVGGPSTGKTSLARALAVLSGRRLAEIPLTPGTDTSDLLGSFEQVEPARRLRSAGLRAAACALSLQQKCLLGGLHPSWANTLRQACSAAQQHAGSLAEPGIVLSSEEASRQVLLLQRLATSCREVQPQLVAAAATDSGPQDQQDLAELESELALLQALFSPEGPGASAAGRFEWVDGTLTRAVQHGGWVLLDNANLVNPTVLDRLNALLEPGGSLYLPECGSVGGVARIVKPHEDFRLILAMDPRHGEVSRAMRNRGIEVCMLPPPPPVVAFKAGSKTQPPPHQLLLSKSSNNSLNTDAAASPCGVPADKRALAAAVQSGGATHAPPFVVSAMVAAHARVEAICRTAHRRAPTTADLSAWAGLAQALLSRGRLLPAALAMSWQQVYPASLGLPAREATAARQVLSDLLAELSARGPVSSANASEGDVAALAGPSTMMDVDGCDAADASTAGDEDALEIEREDLRARMLLAPEPWLASAPAAAALASSAHLTCRMSLTVPNLAFDSSLYGVVRDASLLDHTLRLCLSASLPAAADGRSLALLPSWALAPKVHGGVVSGLLLPPSAGEDEPSGLPALLRLVWSATSVYVQRCTPQDQQLRLLVLTGISERAAAACSRADAGMVTSMASIASVAVLLPAFAAAVLTGREAMQLQKEVASSLAASGMSTSLTQLQPLDLRYCQLYQQRLASVPAAGWSRAWALQVRCRIALVRAQHLVLCKAAQNGAGAAATLGAVPAATAYQESFWRAGRPLERAERDATHPMVDWLSALFEAVSAVEGGLLLQLIPPAADAAGVELTGQLLNERGAMLGLARVQHWRQALWECVHGPVYQPHGLAASLDMDVMTWTWRRMDKAIAKLLVAIQELGLDVGAERLQHLREGMSEALDLDLEPDKPLLWRHGGRPLLPRSEALLQACLRLRRLAHALGAGPGPDGLSSASRTLVDGLAAAGVHLPPLLQRCASEVAAATASGPGTESAARELVEAAVIASLRSDVTLKRSVVQGMALLGVLLDKEHVEQQEQQQQLQAAVAVKSKARLVADDEAMVSAVALDLQPSRREAVHQGLALVTSLVSEVVRRAEQAAEACTAMLLLQPPEADDGSSCASSSGGEATAWLLHLQRPAPAPGAASGALSAVSAPASLLEVSASAALMPSGLMVAPSCRSLQSGLMRLLDLDSLVVQQGLLSRSTHAVLGLASSSGSDRQQLASPSRLSSEALLATTRRQLLVAMHAGGGRCPSDFVPHQQLCWELEEMLNNGVGGGRPRQLLAALHEMWLSWHVAVWEGAAAPAARVGSLAALEAAPVRLYLASHTQAVATLLLEVPCLVQTKPLRLLQLRLAVRHLQQQAAAATAVFSPSPPGEITDTVCSAQTGLFVQLLLCHVPSLSTEQAKSEFVLLLQQLLDLAGRVDAVEASGPTRLPVLLTPAQGVPSPQEQGQWLDALARLIEHSSSHVLLCSLLRLLVLPCAQVLMENLTVALGAPQPAAAAGSHALMAGHGRSWLLLGALRLQLASPPRGIDPAGKYLIAARHLRSSIAERIDPEAEVRRAMQLLPGGHDEVPQLGELAAERVRDEAALVCVAARVVPRPEPSQYAVLAGDVAGFVGSLGSVARILSLLEALHQLTSPSGSTAANLPSPAAVQEAAIWQDNAGTWASRLSRQYDAYLDIVQPVTLAVQEVRHGLALLSAAAAMSMAETGAGAGSGELIPSAGHLLPYRLQALALRSASALLSFPANLKQPSAALSVGSLQQQHHPLLLLPGCEIGDENSLQLVSGLAAAAARSSAPPHLDTNTLSKIYESASYSARLQALRVAMHVACREVLSTSGAAVESSGLDLSLRGDSAASASSSSPSLGGLFRLEGLWDQLHGAWQQLQAFEEARAAEEAEVYKNKDRSTNIKSQEEDDEDDFKTRNLNPWAAFADLVPADDDGGPPDPMDEHGNVIKRPELPDADGQPMASEAQARTAAARQLLEGELLEDLVAVYSAAVMTVERQQRQHMAPSQAALLLAGQRAARERWLGPRGVTRSFKLSYELGAQLIGWLGGAVGAELDSSAQTGHLMRACLMSKELGKAPAATSAAAAAGPGVKPGRKKSRKAATSAAAAWVMSPDEGDEADQEAVDGGVDINGACVEEISLLQAPVADVDSRLRALLADYPDHPVLLQLVAIAARCLVLPATAPLKTALTGLELLLARAQVWEETAAKFVSISAQLHVVAALATRWRQLELASWRTTLKQVLRSHAAGARRSWFHLYGLLVLGLEQEAPEDTEAAEPAATAVACSQAADEKRYRRTASALEAFVQTSTIGEFDARLRLLSSFHSHLSLRLAAAAAGPSGAGQAACGVSAGVLAATVAALANMVQYYRQFSPAVRRWIEAGLTPLERDLQGFIALAKWEDRGFYAMRASAEKAQRYLHRLRRRAEDAMKQPLAVVMAEALRGMGVQELSAAAAAAVARDSDAAPKAAAAKKPAPAAGQLSEAPVLGMDADEGTGKAAAAMDLAGGQTNRLAWSVFCDAAVAQAALHVLPCLPAAAPSVGSSYSARLPKLTSQLAKVLTASLVTATTAPVLPTDEPAEDLLGDEDTSARVPLPALLPHEAIEEVSTSAAVRASELRSDVSKGARLRKRKALSDLLQALAELGLSRRASAVPAHDRSASSWFKHTPPGDAVLACLLHAEPGQQQQPVAPEALEAGRALWSRSDVYYYRAMARLQKLQAAAITPHRDVSGGEATAAMRLCEHSMYLCRRQREALGRSAAAYARLLRASVWLEELAAAPASVSGLEEVGTKRVQVPPQGLALSWMAAQQRSMERLSLLTREQSMLLAALRDVGAVPGQQQQQLAAAAPKCEVWADSLERCRAALEAQALQCRLPATAAMPGEPSEGGAGDCAWVSAAAWQLLTDNHRQLCVVHAEAAALMPLSSGALTPPGLQKVVLELGQAVAESSSFSSRGELAQTAADSLAPPPCQVEGGSTTGTEDQLDAAIKSVLLWAQGMAAATAVPTDASVAAAAAAAASSETVDGASKPDTIPDWTRKWERGVGLRHVLEVTSSVSDAMRDLSTASDLAAAASPTGEGEAEATKSRQQHVVALAARLGRLAPALRLVAAALQQWCLPALSLHKATAKLAYICTAICSSLVCEGYCMPEGEAVEGKDGPGEFKEAEGTGLGDGDTKGAKDISDQIKDEDQLLGAEQKKEPGAKKEEHEQDDGPKEEDQAKGIEMNDDFEGQLEDVDAPKDEDGDNEPSEEEEGDDDRIEQQMGEDLGDNQEVVDEKMWGDEDRKDKPDKPDEKYEKDAPLQVEDKTDLDYAAGGEEDPDKPKDDKKQDKGKEEKKKEKQKQKQEGGEGPEEEKMEVDEEAEEEGRINDDIDDKYEDKHFAKPEAPEEEMELPENLNLDGAEDEEKPQEEKGAEDGEENGPEGAAEKEKPGGAEKEEAAGGPEEEEKGAEAAPDGDEGGDNAPPVEPEAAGDAMDVDGPADGGDDMDQDKPGDAQDAAGAENQADDNAEAPPDSGMGMIDPDQEEDAPAEEKKEGDEDAALAHAGQEEPKEEGPREQQQAGPQGVASAAAPSAASTGQAKGVQAEEEKPEEEGKEDEIAEGAADAAAPESAPKSHQGAAGLSSANEQGAPAPLQASGEAGGEDAAGEKERERQRRQQARAQPNPLRSLGDALERWRADLSVSHDANEPHEDDADEAAVHDPSAAEEQVGSNALQHQFLHAEEQLRDGDTQALAPATEEQAGGLESLDVHQQQQQQEDGEHEGLDDAAAAAQAEQDMDASAGAGEDGDGAEGEAKQSEPASGSAPRKWGGGSKASKSTAAPKQPGREDAAQGNADEAEAAAEAAALEAEAARRQALLDSLGQAAQEDKLCQPEEEVAGATADMDTGVAGEDDRALSSSVARLALDQAEGEEALDQKAPAVPLDAEEVSELRRELDAQLREAAAGAVEASVSADEALQRYGGEVWSRCEALTAGLASELTEQLRLILEPTLASKMAGDYKTGKRINMKKVISYIASHFRKDKIWMRRSRPDKRRYQVVLAVDDSRSMAENGCGGVALESLSLICKAMSRLEVGQVGVIKFGGGDGVVPLHPLDTPFSDSVGPKLASALRFQGESTIADAPVAELMAGLGHILDVAKHGVGAGGIGAGTQDLSQLVIILADGRFHERESLKAAVREVAARPGVCLAFLALDSAAAAAGGSLMDMQTVSFQGGKPVFTKYMDAFPFPYYVLLRDVAALPQTLAGLLRQWFELSAL